MTERLGLTKPQRRTVIVDSHCDSILDHVRGLRDLGRCGNCGHLDLPRLIKAGVTVQFMACYIEPQFKPERGLSRVLTLIDAIYRLAEENNQSAALATNYSEVVSIADTGRVALIISVEGGEALGAGQTSELLAALRVLYRLGVRCLSLTWNQRNLLADGVAESDTGGGLTEAGVAVVREMNRLGMIIDVSHLSEAGFWHVAKISNRPVLASHSNAKTLCGHQRNLTDEQIRYIAETGGVVGITFAPAFLDHDPARATLERVIDHIEYVAGLIGFDHVGIGSDFDGIELTPAGLNDAAAFPALVQGLRSRGINEEDIHKIMGKNHLRLFREVVG